MSGGGTSVARLTSAPWRRYRAVFPEAPVAMLGELILTGLRELGMVFAQAPTDIARPSSVTTELLHVVPARFLPRRNLGLHRRQAFLARC
jgi:hypothetical protein